MGKTPKDEDGILVGMIDGAVRGVKFLFKAAAIAGVFIVIQEYPEESKQIALTFVHSIGDLFGLLKDWVTEVPPVSS